jgi:hypothetical protein
VITDHYQTIQHKAAVIGLTLSTTGAAVSLIDTVDRLMRMGSSLVAIATGVAALVFYGRQNGWWR